MRKICILLACLFLTGCLWVSPKPNDEALMDMAVESAAIEDYSATGLTVQNAIQTLLTNDLTELFATKTEVENARDSEANLLAKQDAQDALIATNASDITGKQATITGAATTIDDADLTASRALISNGSGKVAVSPVTSTELGYVDGVTSAIQTQLTTNAGAISTLDSAATKDADTDVSSNGWVLDEDDMSSDDATKVPTQQSVKAYIDLDFSVKTANYTVLTSDHRKVIVLGSGSSGGRTFTMPSVGASDDGLTVHFYNESDYTLLIQPSDTDSIWNSGAGYGIEVLNRGAYCTLIYDHSTTTWLPLNIGGGRWMVEALHLHLPLRSMTVYDIDSASEGMTEDLSNNHYAVVYNGVRIAAGLYQDVSLSLSTDEYITAPDNSDWNIFHRQY